MVATPSTSFSMKNCLGVAYRGSVRVDLGAQIGRHLADFEDGLGVDADHVVDDELEAGQADAFVRDLGELEGELRIADVHHDLHRRLGQVAHVGGDDLEVELAAVHVAGVAFGTGDGDFIVLSSTSVALPQPTMAGMPSSRAMMAAWQVRPPRLVTMAAARFITGSQFGSVMSVTSTSPAFTRSISEASLTTPTWPAPIFWPMARPWVRTCRTA
jgi:hypothetical protein